jgi:hypothetical protein
MARGKVPVWEKGGRGQVGGREEGEGKNAAKLKSVWRCGGEELGDVLLALLAQEEGYLQIQGESGGKVRQGKRSGQGRKGSKVGGRKGRERSNGQEFGS